MDCWERSLRCAVRNIIILLIRQTSTFDSAKKADVQMNAHIYGNSASTKSTAVLIISVDFSPNSKRKLCSLIQKKKNYFSVLI